MLLICVARTKILVKSPLYCWVLNFIVYGQQLSKHNKLVN
jgi:hypothetical protein